MYSVGGIKNLISGNLPDTAYDGVPVLAPTSFNDTLNGSAVGFARGLTGKATILIAEIARNLTQAIPKSSVTPPSRRSNIEDVHEDLSVGKELLSAKSFQMLTYCSDTQSAFCPPISS
jgi:hypothetical protein